MPRAVVFGTAGARLTAHEAAFFREADPWGFILFARNIETPEQLYALTEELRQSVGRDCLILIDQEGGRVARLRGPHWQEFPDPLVQMQRNPDPAVMALRYRIIGAELRNVGIDANCIPVLDVACPETHAFLKSRCFGTDPDVVATAGQAAARGLISAGALPVIKHIPGHGRATVDSHMDPPVVEASLAELAERDFRPFEAMSDTLMGMTSHVVYRALDDVPGTHSFKVIGTIRDRIGFDGLLFTDDLSMEALDGTHAERATKAIKAGCDVVLHCSGHMAEMEDIASVVPVLQGNALRRADAAINGRPPQDIVDIPALMSEYGTMMSLDS